MPIFEDPFLNSSESEMRQLGFDLDKIPRDEFKDHVWADALLMFWSKNVSLPSPEQLAEEMFDEWDDPVSVDDAKRILGYLTS